MKRKILIASGSSIIVLLLLLLWNPKYVEKTTELFYPPLHVFIDNSWSMLPHSGTVRKNIAHILTEHPRVQLYRFGIEIKKISEAQNLTFLEDAAHAKPLSDYINNYIRPEENVCIISDFYPADREFSILRTNAQYVAVNKSYPPACIFFPSVKTTTGLIPGIKNEIPIEFRVTRPWPDQQQRYSAEIRSTIITPKRTARVQFTNQITFSLTGGQTVFRTNLNYVPEENSILVLECVLPGYTKSAAGNALHGLDCYVFFCETGRVSAAIAAFTPDYDIKLIRHVLEKYQIFDSRYRSFFNTTLYSTADAVSFFDTDRIQDGSAIHILYNPPARIAEKVLKLKNPAIIFHTEKSDQYNSVNQGLIRKSDSDTMRNLIRKYSFMEIFDTPAENEKFWEMIITQSGFHIIENQQGHITVYAASLKMFNNNSVLTSGTQNNLELFLYLLFTETAEKYKNRASAAARPANYFPSQLIEKYPGNFSPQTFLSMQMDYGLHITNISGMPEVFSLRVPVLEKQFIISRHHTNSGRPEFSKAEAKVHEKHLIRRFFYTKFFFILLILIFCLYGFFRHSLHALFSSRFTILFVLLLTSVFTPPLAGNTPRDTTEETLAKPDFIFAVLKYSGGGDWYEGITGAQELMIFLENNTQIHTKKRPETVEPGSALLRTYPFIYLTGHGGLVCTSREIAALREYLLAGGFLFINDDYGLDPFVRKTVREMFPEKEFVTLPNTHELFSIYFKFPNGTPKIHEHDGGPPATYALYYGNRIIILYTFNTDIGDGWAPYQVHKDPENKRTEALRFGVNVILFSMTQ